MLLKLGVSKKGTMIIGILGEQTDSEKTPLNTSKLKKEHLEDELRVRDRAVSVV